MTGIADFARGELPRLFENYLTADERLRKVADAVREDFASSGLTAHNWEHIWRDTLNAIVIGEAEGADMGVVLPAILMHDIGFLWGATGKTHGAVGADRLAEFLDRHGIEFSDEESAHIAACIRTHKGSMHDESPETLEAKVVADADLLDKFGAFGVYSSIRTYTEFDYPIEKILDRRESFRTLSLETATGKAMAEPGRQFVLDFFEALDKAYEPYRAAE